MKRGRGRPPLAGKKGVRYQVSLPPKIAAALRKHGYGSISLGIIRAVVVMISRDMI
jgi:hypothetical protein